MFKLNDFTVTELDNIDEKYLIPYYLTGKKIMHNQGFTGEGIKWAVVDTGCDWNHEALINNIVEKDHNICGYGGGSMDDVNHGSVVASEIIEIMPNCEIVPYKVLAPYGGENEWVIEAINQIADRDDIDGINMSLSSMMKYGSFDYLAFHEAIKRCQAKNIFICVASGNTGEETELYPACFEEVTTVGAVDVYRNEAWFSTESNHVDVCQVGIDLVGACLNGDYCKMSGTSMATPIVSGMAGLLIEKYKLQHDGEKPEGSLINKMLKLFAVDLGIKGLDSKTGAGFITFDPSASIMTMQLDSNVYTVNGEVFSMDVSPFLKTPENRTLVPVRYANHGKEVYWDGTTKTITIV